MICKCSLRIDKAICENIAIFFLCFFLQRPWLYRICDPGFLIPLLEISSNKSRRLRLLRVKHTRPTARRSLQDPDTRVPLFSGKVTKANERARINRPAGRAIWRKEENRSPTLSDSLSLSIATRKGHGRAAEASPGRVQQSREAREQDLLLLKAETSPGRASLHVGKKKRRRGSEGGSCC
jgi:hypothetical protein